MKEPRRQRSQGTAPTRENLGRAVPPRIAKALPRTRLFARLDALDAQPLTWVAGTAGAGKTVLLASYLQARALPTLWYRVRAADAEPASFFAGLREAAQLIGIPNADTLPLLTGEYTGGEATFTRCFFERLAASTPASFTVVLDDFQQVSPEAPLQRLLAALIEDLPPGLRLFVLSRTEPYTGFSRARATRSLGLIGGEELRLSTEETHGLIRLSDDLQLGQDSIHAIEHEAQGWAAGVVLLLEHQRRAGHRSPSSPGPGDAMFDYFATEVLEGCSPELRDFLLRTAIVPDFDVSLANRLTRAPDPEALLHTLVNRNLFIYIHGGATERYQYHPLFRAFLLSRAPALLGTAWEEAEQCGGAGKQEGAE